MNQDALTAPEVAELLKISQNTVYELVKRGQLNCYKVGRKMRFTYEDVQNYINSSRTAPLSEKEKAVSAKKETRVQESGYDNVAVSDMAAGSLHLNTAVFRLCGQDEILDVLAKYMNLHDSSFPIERVHKGSYDSLSALYKDQVIAAASHMWDRETDSYNLPYLKKMVPGCDVVVIHLAKRMQGFYVAQGNPKHIQSWEDLRRNDLRLANREPGAGTRILLDEHLQQMNLDVTTIAGYDTAFPSHLAVAGCVSKGEADFGIGTQKSALNIRGVEFVPLQMEEYDLVVKKQNFNDSRIRLMLQILQSEEFKEQFRYLNGYEISGMGQIVEEVV
jgi:putative molybdopterin biosynthesis protein